MTDDVGTAVIYTSSVFDGHGSNFYDDSMSPILFEIRACQSRQSRKKDKDLVPL